MMDILGCEETTAGGAETNGGLAVQGYDIHGSVQRRMMMQKPKWYMQQVLVYGDEIGF